MDKTSGSPIGRREFGRRWARLALGASALSTLAAPRARAQALRGTGEVVVCTWGGSYAEAQKKAFFEPFEKESGIRVRIVGVPDLAKLHAMVSNKAVEWDLVDAEGQMMLRLAGQDMLERVDYAIVPKADLIPELATEFGIGSVAYSYVVGWSTRRYGSKEPAGWKDFYDAAAFPGRRALYAQPMPNLEFALLAAGVPMDRLYPLDVDRAFRVLEQYRSLVNVWYKSITQIPTLMRGEEVDLIEGTSTRMIELQRSGVPVGWSWSQGAWMQSYWIIPRGARSRENAQKLLAFYTRPENEAQFVQAFPLGMPSKKAYPLMPKETLALLPTAPGNIERQFRVDPAWWAKNVEEITKRWLAFVG
jgi:putative spermidine/putrescine transport system substrate-binding protein